VTRRPVTGGYQHRTPATVPKAFHEEPGRMISPGRQNVCKSLWHRPLTTGEIRGHPPFFCSPPNFLVPSEICFKHVIRKILPPKKCIFPPNLKTWLRACLVYSQDFSKICCENEILDENLFCSATTGTKTTLGIIHPTLVQLADLIDVYYHLHHCYGATSAIVVSCLCDVISVSVLAPFTCAVCAVSNSTFNWN